MGENDQNGLLKILVFPKEGNNEINNVVFKFCQHILKLHLVLFLVCFFT